MSELEVGKHVEIVGSKTPGGHQGKRGVVRQFVDAEQNPAVQLEDGQLLSFWRVDVAPVPSTQLRPGEGLRVGLRVQIVGSMSPGGHIGKQGRISSFVDAENPAVQLDDGRLVSFYRSDVSVLPGGSAGEPFVGIGGAGASALRLVRKPSADKAGYSCGPQQLAPVDKAWTSQASPACSSTAPAPLRIGDRVEIVGSQTPGGHRGKRGKVTQFVDAENPAVLLDDGQTLSFFKADVRALPLPERSASFQIGQRVEITGSLTPGGHKGKSGVITQFVDAENPAIRLDDGQVISVYRSDVTLPPPSPVPAVAAPLGAAPPPLVVGQRVQITGTLTPGAHRGKAGVITQFVDAENPAVRLDDGQVLSFYRADVTPQPVLAPAASASTSAARGTCPSLAATAPNLGALARRQSLHVGQLVEITGSRTPGGHRGRTGEIVQFVEGEHPAVRFTDGQLVSLFKEDVTTLPRELKALEAIPEHQEPVRARERCTSTMSSSSVDVHGVPAPPEPLKVGQRVEITGALTPGGHLGRKGHITQFVDSENPAVRLDDGQILSFYKADVTPMKELVPASPLAPYASLAAQAPAPALPQAPPAFPPAPLLVGMRVKITGSLTPGCHSGKLGVITQFVDAENPAVRLDAGTELSFYKADVSPAPTLAPAMPTPAPPVAPAPPPAAHVPPPAVHVPAAVAVAVPAPPVAPSTMWQN